jgi:hypothetical protein
MLKAEEAAAISAFGQRLESETPTEKKVTYLTGKEPFTALQKMCRINQIYYYQTDKKADILRTLLKHPDLFQLAKEDDIDTRKFL